MKKPSPKNVLGLIITAALILALSEHFENGVEEAYAEGVFFGYADGYLKHKYHPESNEFFIYDENRFEYLSVQTEVYVTQDRVYHRKGCTAHSNAEMIKDIFDDYYPCPSCKPPIVLQ